MTIPQQAVEVHRRYLALADLAQREFGALLAGKLFSVAGFDPEINTLIVAAEIASAATLLIESDRAAIRECNRSRACDFAVHTLTEATRILKNQIRKKQPVAVLLIADPAQIAIEMLDRGLQPDLVSCRRGFSPERFTEPFATRGAVIVGPALQAHSSIGIGSSRLLPVYCQVDGAPGLWLPKVDALAAEILTDAVRRHWIESAPSYLDRLMQFARFVEMTNEEAQMFSNRLRASIDSGEIDAPIRLSIGGDEHFFVAGKRSGS